MSLLLRSIKITTTSLIYASLHRIVTVVPFVPEKCICAVSWKVVKAAHSYAELIRDSGADEAALFEVEQTVRDLERAVLAKRDRRKH